MALSDKWTRLQLRTACRRELLDPNGVHWTDAELNSYIESGQDIIQFNNEFVWGTALATESTSLVTLSTIASDILRVDGVYFNNIRLTPRSIQEMSILDRDWRSTTQRGPGVVVMVDEDTIQLWPPPAASGNLYLEYPATLTFGTDTSTMQLPAWTRYAIPHYVCYRAYLRDGPNHSLQRAARYKTKFRRAMDRIKQTRAAYFPQKYTSLVPGGKYEADILLTRRRTKEDIVPVITLSYHYDEVPSGTVNGVNDTFTLTHTPDPVASFKLWVNGVLYTRGTHYVLNAGSTVLIFNASYIPQTGDLLFSTYRYQS